MHFQQISIHNQTLSWPSATTCSQLRAKTIQNLIWTQFKIMPTDFLPHSGHTSTHLCEKNEKTFAEDASFRSVGTLRNYTMWTLVSGGSLHAPRRMHSASSGSAPLMLCEFLPFSPSFSASCVHARAAAITNVFGGVDWREGRKTSRNGPRWITIKFYGYLWRSAGYSHLLPAKREFVCNFCCSPASQNSHPGNV